MSKRFIIISLLMLLASACTQQVTVLSPPPEATQSIQSVQSNAEESIPTVTATPLIFAATEQPLPTFDSICPGASAPHVAVGQQVTVVADDTDRLKLRSEARISPETVMMELDQFSQLKILEGFVCVHSDETQTSYWFWKVRVIPTGEVGWVSEGDSSHYFIETTSGQPLPASDSICPGAPAPHVAIGQEVTVVVVDTDKLKLRSEPNLSPDTVKMDLDKLTHLKILEGPVCFSSEETQTSYWFWKVTVLSSGAAGWVAEGDESIYFIE